MESFSCFVVYFKMESFSCFVAYFNMGVFFMFCCIFQHGVFFMIQCGFFFIFYCIFHYSLFHVLYILAHLLWSLLSSTCWIYLTWYGQIYNILCWWVLILITLHSKLQGQLYMSVWNGWRHRSLVYMSALLSFSKRSNDDIPPSEAW